MEGSVILKLKKDLTQRIIVNIISTDAECLVTLMLFNFIPKVVRTTN